ncbi:MAG TPA: hypothetical protein VK281_17175 [Xanthobacteraceae bacterium]|nr:hypothetical protein [Xanthobacteraceae bacterium]
MPSPRREQIDGQWPSMGFPVVPAPPPAAEPRPQIGSPPEPTPQLDVTKPVAVPAPPAVHPPQPERHPMFKWLADLLTGLSWSTLILMAIAVWFAARNGVPSVIAWCTRMWGTIGADVKAAQTSLAGDVAILKNDVEAIKAHLGLAVPAAGAAGKPAGS